MALLSLWSVITFMYLLGYVGDSDQGNTPATSLWKLSSLKRCISRSEYVYMHVYMYIHVLAIFLIL